MFRFSSWLSSLRSPRRAPSGRPPRRGFRPALESLEGREVLSTFLVTNTNDAGEGSLRQAILGANAVPDSDQIRFDIAGGGSINVINLESPLPAITAPVLIDGFTQPGARPNSLAVGFDADLSIAIRGAEAGPGADGLTIQGGGTTIRGLIIFAFRKDDLGKGGNGIVLVDVPGNAGNAIEGTDLGDNDGNGIVIGAAAGNNRVGGLAPAQRNTISRNGGDGILVFGNANVIQGNYIGTSVDGRVQLGNGGDGIDLRGDANLVGGVDPAARNLISGNSLGVRVEAAADNQVQNNFIGTDATGTKAVPNGEGVFLAEFSTGTLIAGNLISGNLASGVNVFLADHTTVRGNFIGTDVTGARALANVIDGVQVSAGSAANVIGGPDRADRNVISGNGRAGVAISAPGNAVENNLIGTSVGGDAPLANSVGVFIQNAGDNFVTGNVVSGNLEVGVRISGQAATGNVVQGNLVGLARNGGNALGNGGAGIEVSNGAAGTLIGGDAPAQRNVLSANGGSGVLLGDNAGPTRIAGNYIGTDARGLVGRGNLDEGIFTFSGNHQILNNLIAANVGDGVQLAGTLATGNVIQGNTIGTNAAGAAGLGNVQDGIEVIDGASDNIIGGILPGQGNVIAFNGASGVRVIDDDIAGTAGNTVSGNAVFDNAGLGIDLKGEGPTPNDPLDADAGPNGLQNTPVLVKLVQGAAKTLITGTINTTAKTRLRIELFASAAADPSGSGEGERFLGHVEVLTDKKGKAPFTFALAGRLTAGEVVTATATNLATGDTSEFSAGLKVIGTVRGTKYIDRNGNGRIDSGEAGLGGVTIFADLNDNGAVDAGDVSTVSAANGSFTLLIPQDGTFAIREVVPDGFRQTTPERFATIAGANVVNGILIGNQRLPQAARQVSFVSAGEFDRLRASLVLSLNNLSAWALQPAGRAVGRGR